MTLPLQQHLPLQEQLTATKRHHILQAAATVFAQQGFHAATIKDVARAAGVADGTIYNYFQNKHALLLGLLSQMTLAAQQAVDPSALRSLDLRGFLREFLCAPLRALHGESFELLRAVLSEALVNRELAQAFRSGVLEPMLAGAAGFLNHWAEHRQEERGEAWTDPELLVRLLSSLVLGLLVQAALGDEPLTQSWDTLPETLAELLVRGLA